MWNLPIVMIKKPCLISEDIFEKADRASALPLRTPTILGIKTPVGLTHVKPSNRYSTCYDCDYGDRLRAKRG
jgi:hypothetical protein